MAGFYKTPAAKAVLFFCIVLFLSAGSADAAETLLKPGAAELKKMSTFLSNFTEIGLDNFYVKGSGVDGSGDLLALSADDPADLVRFGIWHNYRNNYDSRVAPCKAKGCKWGSLTIDGKHVLESVKKYFDIDLKNRSITESDPPYYYDGKLYHFEGADGEATYFTDVRKVVRQADGNLRMSGELYNAEDRNDRPETFEALVKPYKFDGKETWAVLRMKSN